MDEPVTVCAWDELCLEHDNGSMLLNETAADWLEPRTPSGPSGSRGRSRYSRTPTRSVA